MWSCLSPENGSSHVQILDATVVNGPNSLGSGWGNVRTPPGVENRLETRPRELEGLP